MIKDIPLAERIIFALDTASQDQAKAWVKLLGGRINYFKVGLQLFLAHGFTLADWVLDQGHKLMLDLKFLDIPQTVALAMEQAATHGAHLVTVHAHTTAMLRAAVNGAGNTGVLGVTVLTSVGPQEVRELRCDATVEDLVRTRAGYALGAGCAGVVASGLEAKALRRDFGQDFLIVSPGIRPSGSDHADQRRVLTPARALAQGADHLVVGRPISQAQEPLKAAEAMLAEVEEALADLRG